MTPQHMLASLRETDTDLGPLAAAPLIERGRRQRHLRRTLAAATTAAGVFVVGGVGFAVWPRGASIDTTPPAAAGIGLVQQVSEAVLEAGTASIDLKVHVTTPKPTATDESGESGVEIPQDGHASGGVDFRRHATSLTVGTTLGGKALSMKVLVTPTNSYASNPLQPGKWIALPSLNELAGSDASAIMDPQSILDQLPKDAGDTVFVGNETVRGTPTSHYRGTFAPDGDFKLPFDVWLDHQGLPRRVVVTSPAEAGTPAAPETPSGTVTLEMFNFGKQVSISLPSAGSLQSMEEAEKSLKSLIPDSTPGS